MRIRFDLEFDGQGFCGWQMQAEEREAAGRPSIQATLEKAIGVALRRPDERVVVHGCGRTDSGVHAEAYACHFDVAPAPESIDRFRHSVNALLPPAISVLQASVVGADFHALESLTSKTYEYRLLVRRAKPALELGRVHWIPLAPDAFRLDALAAAMEEFRGTHDFVAFASVDGTAKTTRRTIFATETDVRSIRGGCLVALRFQGEGFLKQQVRTMVGTALQVAEGKRSLESLRDLLSRPGARTDAGPCMPPEGLFLKSLSYDPRGDDGVG